MFLLVFVGFSKALALSNAEIIGFYELMLKPQTRGNQRVFAAPKQRKQQRHFGSGCDKSAWLA